MKRAADIRGRGAALIIVLAFLVILSAISVAYLSRTTTDRQLAHGTFNESKADQIARSGLDVVVADLKQEIRNGSSVSTINDYTIYSPSANANMLPKQSGTPAVGATPIPNLVRISIRSDRILAPGVPSRASAVGSTPPPSPVLPKKGEITMARWNKHYLIPRLNASSTLTDSTPVTSFTPPDWVLVTRGGPTAFAAWNSSVVDSSASNTSFVVGRYAYAIYDEGSLLDANVAGYPSPNPSPQVVGRKGTIAYADVTSLPTSSASPAPTFGPARVNQMVGWRNYASTQPGGSIQNNSYVFTAASAQNFVNLVTGNTGFLTVPPTIYNGSTDQAFATRQQLLAFRTAAGDLGFSQNVLQYLGTFSRELNRPSWKPAAPSAINPDINSIRAGAVFTRPDGTQTIAGEPLMKQRFALTRLNGLGPAGIVTSGNSTWKNGVLSPADATTVQRDFGLQWDATNVRWNYVGNSGSTIQSSLKTLSQVASENREPNFFEVLKAVILNGSLGLGTNANTLIAAENRYYNTAGGLSADYQIMQIGANIIDGWDADNSPAFINFAGSELAGVENLPYINKILLDFWVSNNGNGGAHDQVYAWLVPSLWNPSQNANDPLKATGDVRFAMTSGSANAVITFNNGDPSISGTPVPKGTPYPYIQVRANAFATACPPVPNPTPAPGTSAPPGNEATPAPGVTPKIGQLSVTVKDTRLYDGLDFGNPITTTRNNAWRIIDKVYPTFASGTTFEMQVAIVVPAAAVAPPTPSPIASPTPSYLKPFITNNPANQTVVVGQAASFSVNAVTNPGPWAFTYQWTKDGTAIPGAVNPTYTTPPTTFADNGSLFAVVVTNGSGSATSNNAVLGVVNTTKWKAYQTWTNCYNGPGPTGSPPDNGAPILFNSGASYKNNSFQDPEFAVLDPRTLRFGVWGSTAKDTGNSKNYDLGAEDTMDQRVNSGSLESVSQMKPQPPSAFPMSSPNGQGYLYAVNSSSTPASDSYNDLDGIKRRGDWTTDINGNTQAKTIIYGSASPTPSPTPKNSQDRPQGLSQPFQSVAELGTVFRDQPWKTLNFSMTASADAGLLDAFTLQDVPLVAGKTSLNTKQAAVLHAILREANHNIAGLKVVVPGGAPGSEDIVPADIDTVVSRLTSLTTANPMINKSELVTTLMEDASLTANLWNKSTTNPYNKESRETVIRAFGDSTQTRTWNLMIDVVAQSGRYPPNAAALKDFIVEGEKRYWLHVAIDRFTGEVIDQQLEAVYE